MPAALTVPAAPAQPQLPAPSARRGPLAPPRSPLGPLATPRCHGLQVGLAPPWSAPAARRPATPVQAPPARQPIPGGQVQLCTGRTVAPIGHGAGRQEVPAEPGRIALRVAAPCDERLSVARSPCWGESVAVPAAVLKAGGAEKQEAPEPGQKRWPGPCRGPAGSPFRAPGAAGRRRTQMAQPCGRPRCPGQEAPPRTGRPAASRAGDAARPGRRRAALEPAMPVPARPASSPGAGRWEWDTPAVTREPRTAEAPEVHVAQFPLRLHQRVRGSSAWDMRHPDPQELTGVAETNVPGRRGHRASEGSTVAAQHRARRAQHHRAPAVRVQRSRPEQRARLRLAQVAWVWRRE